MTCIDPRRVSQAARAFVCDDCAAEYPLHRPITLCPDCGGLLEVRYDLGLIAPGLPGRAREGRGMWRWRELLPLPLDVAPVSLGEGDTPLLELSMPGGASLLVKNDGLMPTGSFKDRGFALAVSFAAALGVDSGFTYSSGNAAGSFGAYCARAGIAATVFVEDLASELKIAAAAMAGADVRLLRFDSSAEIFASLDALAREGRYSFVNFLNPVRHEAMKVYAYELCEALGWRAPDVVIHPVGTGGGLWGCWKGFLELRALGLIDRLPRMVGVQPAACAPIVEAMAAGRAACITVGDPAATIAQSIATDTMPYGGRRVLRALRDSGGRAYAVPEQGIEDAMRALGRAGISAEPSGAVAYAAAAAGLREGWIAPDETAVAVVTGTGLKQPAALISAAPAPGGRLEAADVGAWRRVLDGAGRDAAECMR
ncbi:pyridoxal-phosphate dependent enzyme [Microbacterium sp.]|uniref:threonine synthase n=1 Tax=Microbacterium sp. TaxID=51671 RepID=UPI00333E8EFA